MYEWKFISLHDPLPFVNNKSATAVFCIFGEKEDILIYNSDCTSNVPNFKLPYESTRRWITSVELDLERKWNRKATREIIECGKSFICHANGQCKRPLFSPKISPLGSWQHLSVTPIAKWMDRNGEACQCRRWATRISREGPPECPTRRGKGTGSAPMRGKLAR